MKRLLVLTLCGGLATSPSSLASQAPSPDSELEQGVRQAQRGAFEDAVITLDAVVHDLAAEGAPPEELTRAHVYLAIAYLGLEQEQKARVTFLEALRIDPELELSAQQFPPRILRFFEAIRQEVPPPPEAEPRPAAPETAAPPGGDSESAQVTPPHPEEGRGKRRLLLLGGGVVLLAGVAAAASKGRLCSACTGDGDCRGQAACVVFADEQMRCGDLTVLESANPCDLSCDGVPYCR